MRGKIWNLVSQGNQGHSQGGRIKFQSRVSQPQHVSHFGLFSEVISYPMCHVLFVRIKSPNLGEDRFTQELIPRGRDRGEPFQKLPSMRNYQSTLIFGTMATRKSSLLCPGEDYVGNQSRLVAQRRAGSSNVIVLHSVWLDLHHIIYVVFCLSYLTVSRSSLYTQWPTQGLKQSSCSGSVINKPEHTFPICCSSKKTGIALPPLDSAFLMRNFPTGLKQN